MRRQLGPGDLLVLRALGLGDLLTGVPALRGLRRRFPERTLLLAAPAAIGAFLRGRGVVDEVLVTDGLAPLEAEGSGHLAVDLHGKGPESRQLLADTGPDDLLGFATTGPHGPFEGPQWVRHEHEVARWCRLVAAWDARCGPEDLRLRPREAQGGALPGAPVVVHPGAAFAARRWPVERWALVVADLVARGLEVVVTGTAAERPLGAALAAAGAVDRCGASDLDGLADLVAGARLVLSGDTGTAHLATAFAVPSVTLFGPTPPAWWGPAVDADLHPVLWHGDPAAQDYVGDPHGGQVDPTLARITVEEVLDAAHAQLAAHRPAAHRAPAR
ncbi:glycosyltransferase family 9 protein [Kineococcus sp. SYSU DK006]|uniref:glycosyltransferase family 9 protein n=1 Tax=Kineococcus sp. SYSU DK006 TaxID=3383127 RepID=UPI003D7E44AA